MCTAYAHAYQKQCADMLQHVTHISPFDGGQKPTYSYEMAPGKVRGSTYRCFILLDKQDKQDMYALLSTFNRDAQIELVQRILKQKNQKPMTRNTIEILEDFRRYKDVDNIGDVMNVVLRR